MSTERMAGPNVTVNMRLFDRRTFLQNGTCALLAVSAAAQQRSGFDAQLDAYIERQKFQGVIVLARGRHIVAQRTAGLASTTTGLPVRLDTVFEGGSISKWIASVVVLKQVDKGRLSLDAPIANYLPDFRRDNAVKLTLRHLMSHASGVPNDVVAALRKDRTLTATADEAVQRWASGDLQFTPGTQWDYSHSNWLLVDAVLRHVTGRDYAELATETLWRPLRLHRSGIREGDSLSTAGMAESRKPDGMPDLSNMPRFMEMAGGFYSTAPEMLRILEAVDTGQVLSANSTRDLFTVRMPEQHYALGGRVRLRNGRPVIWEDGSNRSYRMLAVRVRGSGESVVIANSTGTDQPAMGDLADEALQWLTASREWIKA